MYMSGTAALASARRRRAGGTPQPAERLPSTPESPKVLLTPIDILKHHDKQLTILKKELDELKNQTQPVVSATSSDIDFYKQKYSSLLSEMTEMKTTFVKMQTFCMEINMKVDKMKQSLDKENNDTS
jgi:hypothetical protein